MENNDDSFPLISQPEITIDIYNSPIGNNSNLDGIENQTATSSITSVASTTDPKIGSPSLLKHPFYEVLSGCSRKCTNTIPY